MTVRPLIHWCNQMLSEQDGTPSSKRVAYIGAFLTATVALLGALWRDGMTEPWDTAFLVYCGAFVTGYVGGKVAERNQPGGTP